MTMERKPLRRRSIDGPRTPHIQFRAKTPAKMFRCYCGCGRRASTFHHWIPVRKLREHVRAMRLPLDDARKELSRLVHDERGMSPYALTCHLARENHHPPFQRIEIPDETWNFAEELGLVWLLQRLYP
jgi:hypothetical protein